MPAISLDTLPSLVTDILFYGLLVGAGVFDVLKFRIPNAIVVALPVLFVVAAVFASGTVDWLGHLGAGAVVLVCSALLFHFNLLGGGDAKLLAALAIWAGFDSLLPFLIAVSLLGGLLAMVLLLFRPICARFPAVHWPLSLLPGHPLPYGVAIGGGAVIMRIMFPVF
jgi:prepilin peptidase CpaA